MRGPNVVLLAMRGPLAYEVLRALHAMGARVKLMCDRRSSIRFSQYCETLYVSPDIATESADRILQLVNAQHGREPIDLVVASDVAGVMLLNGIRSELSPPVFPAPDNATLALLDNKWRFQKLCLTLGIPAPDSIFFESKETLDLARVERELGYPVVVKPVDLSGSDGVIIAENAESLLRRLRSDRHHRKAGAGLIAQRYVAGQDWGYIAFAIDGHVDVALTFACGANWRTEYRDNPELHDAARRIIEHVRYTGMVNFDCRLEDETGIFQFLECNPRFSHRITATRLCGLNFLKVALGAEAQLCGDVCYRPLRDVFTRQGAGDLVRGRWPLSILVTELSETVSDPIAALIQKGPWRSTAQRAMSPLLHRLRSARP
ncbi:MAG TPA: ATP-grasp domain-containing protein [Alphaproteobacteria bacterium]|jgi:biotin carboxylase|nr:ATP-grasp domain-containing protein [Alphaproteobacteria bacterium]